MLNVIRHDGPDGPPPLLIAHGLFGSARNWGVLAKRLAQGRTVLAVDMRNHGASPWSDDHGYPAMAQDLADVIEAEGGRADVLGHSMGGKAAMMLALSRGNLVERLIVADIAPVSYGHSQAHNIQAMRSVDLAAVDRRSDAEAQLAAQGVEPALCSFFTQSLDLPERRWRLNLDALAANMPAILSFPDVQGSFGGPALFLSGAQSDYVRAEHRPAIKALFPAARFAKIPGAGHWLHAKKPREFQAAVEAFLSRETR